MLTRSQNYFILFVTIIISIIFVYCLKITSSILRLEFIPVEYYYIKKAYDPYRIKEVLLNHNKLGIYYTSGRKYAHIDSQNDDIYDLTVLNTNKKIKFTHDSRFCISSIEIGFMSFKRGHYLWWMPNLNAVFAEVSKNACSSVLTTIIKRFSKSDNKIDENSPHVSLWSYISSSRRANVVQVIGRSTFHKGLHNTIFLVYDDPVDRFLRAVNDKLLGHNAVASILVSPKNFDKKSLSDFMDKMILVTRIDLTNKYGWDQHLAPITTGFPADVISRVTDFVYLRDLDRFMLEKFKIKQGHFHVTKKKKPFTRDMLTERQLMEIKKLYKKDYEIPKKYSERFFK